MADGLHGEPGRRGDGIAVVTGGGQKALVAAKLVETASRGVFVVAGTYLLPLEDAGRFGVMVTLLGLFAFLAGFERQIDLQRRLVGEDAAAVHAHFSNALRLYLINHLFFAPLLVLCARALCGLDVVSAAGLIVIVIAEQLANQTYQVALLSAKYRYLILMAAAKNVALLIFLVHAWVNRTGVQFQSVVEAWLLVSLVFIMLTALFWWRAGSPAKAAVGDFPLRKQYEASAFHFLIGLVAILSLQSDRLLVATLLTPDQVGTFYRNVVLISVGYIVFNVAFVARLMPRVFLRAKSEPPSALMKPLWNEWKQVAVFAVVATALMFAAPYIYSPLDPARLDVHANLFLWLLMAFILRAAADLAGIVLNARHMETSLLKNQAAALVVGLAATAGLAYGFGPPGAAVGSVVLAAVYLLLNFRTLKNTEASP